MNKPRSEPFRIRERLSAAFLDILFPKAAPAEVLLFFTVVYVHLLSHNTAIQRWVIRCFRNGWDGLLISIQGGLEGIGDLFIVLGGLFHFLLVLWMLLLFFIVAIFPLLAALIVGFSTSFERKMEKGFGAAAMSMFYLFASIFTGYLLYLHIAMSRVFEAESVWESIQYGILWVFFLRQIACGLATLPFMDRDEPRARDIMASRLRDHDSPWLATVLGLVAGAVLTIYFQRSYAVGARAVMFAFIYANILLFVLDSLFSRIPFLSAIRPPSLRKPNAVDPGGPTPLAKRKARSSPSRSVQTASSSPQRPNAVCPVCGKTCRIEEVGRLSKGAYVPCPRCRTRLVPLRQGQRS